MNSVLKKCATIIAVTSAALSVNAAVITSGELTYDDQTNLITGGGNTYLSWNIGASWDYATTLAMTSAGGDYENFHIASQTEAYEFFNLANIGSNVIDREGSQYSYGYTSNSRQDRFGNNYYYGASVAWFLSDEYADVGYVYSGSGSGITIYDSWSSVRSSDYYNISWLLVQDTNATDVSEPGSLALLGLGVLGLGFARKKSKA